MSAPPNPAHPLDAGMSIRSHLGRCWRRTSDVCLEVQVSDWLTFDGGVRLGTGMVAFNASVPLARLTATRGELKLSYPGHEMVFPRDSITSLSKHRGIFSVGVRIEHTRPDYEEFVVFWTFRFRKVKAELEALGYAFKN